MNRSREKKIITLEGATLALLVLLFPPWLIERASKGGVYYPEYDFAFLFFLRSPREGVGVARFIQMPLLVTIVLGTWAGRIIIQTRT